MSAMDKILGRKPVEEETVVVDGSFPVSKIQNPMQMMMQLVSNPAAIGKVLEEASNVAKAVENAFATVIQQQQTIIDQNKQILERLGNVGDNGNGGPSDGNGSSSNSG